MTCSDVETAQFLPSSHIHNLDNRSRVDVISIIVGFYIRNGWLKNGSEEEMEYKRISVIGGV